MNTSWVYSFSALFTGAREPRTTPKMKLASTLSVLALISYSPLATAYSTPRKPLNRRDAFQLITSTAATAVVLGQRPALAFDGSGSSAYAGRTPASKAELRKSYEERIAADVRDFNALGRSISKGETDGDSWVSFFIQFPRREPDAVGRTYAGLADFIGPPDNSKGYHSGGDGYLLAASFAKPGKPSDNLPSVKKYDALAKAFAPIEAAGKKGNLAKAQKEWEKASDLFSQYLGEVGMPSSLSDPLYN